MLGHKGGDNDRPKQDCNNFVVWRINANCCLHPDNLEGNLVIVGCSTAKAWLSGKIAKNMKWDRKAKMLIRVA